MHPCFRILNGGLQQSMVFKGVKFIAVPREHPPLAPEAEVFEEDTFLIMSDDPDYAPSFKHPIRLMQEVESFQPELPGSVIVKGSHPIRMLAVIHDVNRDPTWREEWIKKALFSVFQYAERLKLRTLGLPILGTKHGRLKHPHFAKMLARILHDSKFEHLRLVWLIAPIPANKTIVDILKKETGSEQNERV